MTSTKRCRACMEDREAGSHKKLATSSFPWSEDQESSGSQSYRNVASCLPTTGSEMDILTPFLDNDGDVPMTEVPHRTPATFKFDLDDSIEANSSTREEYREKEICFGALFDVQIACPNHFGLDKSSYALATKPTQALERYPVILREGYYALQSPNKKEFALIDINTIRALKAVQSLGNIRFQAVIQCNAIDRSGTTVGIKSKRNMTKVSINLYGDPTLAKKLGDSLTQERQFLQHPEVVDPGINYDNPHYFKVPGLTVDLNQCIVPFHHGGMPKDVISAEVDKVMDSLCAVDVDMDIPPTDALLTPLMSHQEAALKFIRQREKRFFNTSLWRKREESGKPVFEHQITDQRQFVQPRISAGGILADEMGLGKTLTVLSAIVHSMSEASYFIMPNREISPGDDSARPTRATLVVVPSTQLIGVWKSEMERHLAENCLNVATFHGSDRGDEPWAYVDLDLVLTTYSTLVKDRQNAGVLHRLKWFRIILDEADTSLAHWIRNQETEQFRAVNTLQADRRWCLTGTPIQNRLEDLGALIRFLKVEPFDGETSKVAFRRYIMDPLSSDDEDPCQNLRLLLRSVCLRRTQNRSDLTAKCESVTLSLSPLERSLYHKLLEQTKSRMDMFVSAGSCFQEFTKLFTIILRLRMLCNLGQFCEGLGSQPFPVATAQTCFPADFQVCSDLGCDLCEKEESLGLMKGLKFCPGCSRPLFSINLLGPNCMSETLRSFELSSPQFSGLSNEPSEVTRPLSTSQQSFLEADVSAEGYPTKLFAVAKNLRDNICHSKSIVFSCWRKTLDILSRLLNEDHIQFVLIDGTVSSVERLKRLALFQESSVVSILLMTFGTGAVGLNLTKANRIHIVEPQWNPSVEAQAIGRALRIGQIREVTVVRYVMEHTVEQNILDYQKRKEKLTNLALKGGLEESLSEKLQELRCILQVP